MFCRIIEFAEINYHNIKKLLYFCHLCTKLEMINFLVLNFVYMAVPHVGCSSGLKNARVKIKEGSGKVEESMIKVPG